MCSGGIFDYDHRKDRLAEVELELSEPRVWKNTSKAKELGRERASLEDIVTTIEALDRGLEDTRQLLQLAVEEFDVDIVDEVRSEISSLDANLTELEFKRMFSGQMDSNNAFIEIQAGSGGTEAQDWAEMLLRMYLRWTDDKGFKSDLIEYSAGEVAGVKSATVQVSGNYAYGWLRTEIGVHRLVRKSPFDSGSRRHTSFASIFVSLEISEKIEIDLKQSDVRIDTYRASGAGGQHVNKTDSAVRLTHLPSGVVVQCQNQRSQHKNKEQAFKLLRGRLFEIEEKKRRDNLKQVEENKADIGWGSQIRSYVLDQSRIKDLRTGVESGNTTAVLDGNIDMFVEASLKKGI